jgi:hypothetical protein
MGLASDQALNAIHVKCNADLGHELLTVDRNSVTTHDDVVWAFRQSFVSETRTWDARGLTCSASNVL